MINIHTWWLIPPSRSYPKLSVAWPRDLGISSAVSPMAWSEISPLTRRLRATVDGASHSDQHDQNSQ